MPHLTALDPTRMSEKEIETAVKEAAKGSITTHEVVARVRKVFPDSHNVNVLYGGERHWKVFFWPSVDSAPHLVLCPR